MPHALDKRILRIRLNVAEMLDVEARARAAGQSVNNYVRARLGLQERNVGKRTAEERDFEEDDAMERLRRLGLDPQAYLPDY
ncbi:MAG: hypothetical protein IT165_25170 [Bryobacterales bacterium]|nr:hypothetical protein [Bryobacterales bacterium]